MTEQVDMYIYRNVCVCVCVYICVCVRERERERERERVYCEKILSINKFKEKSQSKFLHSGV